MDSGEGFFTVVGTIMLFALLFIGVLLFEAYSCGAKGKAMGFGAVYSPTTGCMINVEGKWVPLSNYRVL